MAVTTALVAAAAAALVTAAPLAQTAPPRVKKIGNAIREYKDERIQAVIAYEYSNRHHDGDWLLVETAVRTTDRLVYQRADFTLVTPDEKTIPLANQSRFIDEAPKVRRIQQNARVWSRSLDPYFIEKISQRFQLFALPGDGVITDSITTDRYGASFLTLYFASPTDGWPGGSYQLKIDNGKARAAIPVELK
jgi:hypothetical protein